MFWLPTSLTASIVFRFLVELQKKDKERKINNENPELRSKRFLHKVNTIYLFLKKQAGYKYSSAVWKQSRIFFRLQTLQVQAETQNGF